MMKGTVPNEKLKQAICILHVHHEWMWINIPFMVSNCFTTVRYTHEQEKDNYTNQYKVKVKYGEKYAVAKGWMKEYL